MTEPPGNCYHVRPGRQQPGSAGVACVVNADAPEARLVQRSVPNAGAPIALPDSACTALASRLSVTWRLITLGRVWWHVEEAFADGDGTTMALE